ncbi:hypothetical protein ZOSMA_28G00090 [Zostera marina]|uniref:Uncharacterized protein n=1 Tax=Zostera marina TaxID=29655 RepID=A0A0K9PCH6_ZOSMR|nr:hypothetical protein ZOSMA_28G00090 [Zostera marina]
MLAAGRLNGTATSLFFSSIRIIPIPPTFFTSVLLASFDSKERSACRHTRILPFAMVLLRELCKQKLQSKFGIGFWDNLVLLFE